MDLENSCKGFISDPRTLWVAQPVSVPRRLIKYVKDSTDLTIEEIHVAWAQGRLKLLPNGAAASRPIPGGALSLVFEEDRVLLDGQVIRPKQHHFTAILNKPSQTTSTCRDPDGKRDLSEWLAQMPAGTFPVGRLDRATTGLLLFTTDGDLANAVLRPQNHTEKKYWLWLDEVFEADDPRLEALTDKGNPAYDAASRAELVCRTRHHTELHLILDEGKNRQIRRMCRALDLRLVHLHRKSIGPLDHSGLAVGEYRQLTAAEVESLWQATGGRNWVRSCQIVALRRRAAEHRQTGKRELRLERWLNSLDRDSAGQTG